MTWINFHHLFYFHTIAHQGSIAKASRLLKIGQPALSVQLKHLEGALEVKLFERRAQRLKLTPIGKVVLGYSDAIFNLGTEMLEAVKEGRTEGRLRLDIGIHDGIPKTVAHQLVAAAVENESCFVSVTEAGSNELLEGLLSQRLHLILTNSHAPIEKKSEFFSRSIGDFPVLICGAPKFKELKNDFPRSLDGQPFLLPMAHSKLRNDLEHFFSIANIRPHFIGESQESELDKSLAISGHTLIALSSYGLESVAGPDKLLPIGTITNLREQIWLTGIRRHFTHPIAADLMKSFEIKPARLLNARGPRLK